MFSKTEQRNKNKQKKSQNKTKKKCKRQYTQRNKIKQCFMHFQGARFGKHA